jgi:mannitol/fructose-specific phosphotransferase system IIA component (Ntr-type)
MQLALNPVQTPADFTSATLMLPSFRGRSMSEVMCELVQALHQEDASMSGLLLPALKALNRELLTSTALDAGAIFPEVRLLGGTLTRFAVGRAVTPLHWRAANFPPLEIIFLIVQPARTEATGKMLATQLKRFGTNKQCVARLREARNANEMLAVLRTDGRLALT